MNRTDFYSSVANVTFLVSNQSSCQNFGHQEKHLTRKIFFPAILTTLVTLTVPASYFELSVHLLLSTECTSLVMEDAKRRKREWKTKLADMELENLLQLRDALMAHASIHLMESDDCKSTITTIKSDVRTYFAHTLIFSFLLLLLFLLFLLLLHIHIFIVIVIFFFNPPPFQVLFLPTFL